MRRLSRATALVPMLASACSYQLIAPPARPLNLESARTATPGETVATARGGVYSQVFEPPAVVTSAGARRGVWQGTEVGADLSFARVMTGEAPDVDHNLYAARLGVKQNPIRVAGGRSRHFALTGGLGGGFNASAGGFLAADAGFIAAYDNCMVVPFLSGQAAASMVIAAREVDLGERMGKATSSLGLGSGAGVEIPLQRQRCREGKIPARMQLGATAHLLFTERKLSCGEMGCTETTGGDHLAVGFGGGFEIPF
jgi:hypothetical protein